MSSEHYYQYHVFCCQNQREAGHPRGCCADKNSAALLDYLKQQVKARQMDGPGKVRVNKAGCLDRCELGPTLVVYPQGVWYHVENTQDMDEIIEQHLQQGKPVERLRLGVKQKRL